MSSIEFWLTRLTAQTTSIEIRIQGDMPEFTAAEIAQGVAQIHSRPIYQAALAYYCDDDRSVDELNAMMAYWCWRRIRTKHPDMAVKGAEIDRVSELGVLHYLNPNGEENRSVRACARYVQVDRRTWENKYAAHRTAVIHKLAEMLSDAKRQIRIVMKQQNITVVM